MISLMPQYENVPMSLPQVNHSSFVFRELEGGLREVNSYRDFFLGREFVFIPKRFLGKTSLGGNGVSHENAELKNVYTKD